jgi:hypothetical protein
MTAHVLWTHALYLAINVGVTVWVARTLFRNGRVFLIDSFLGNEKLADSVNHPLVVGFYLVNLGYIAMAVKYGERPRDAQGVFEVVAWKVGIVLLILGVLHFINLFLFTRARRRSMERTELERQTKVIEA